MLSLDARLCHRWIIYKYYIALYHFDSVKIFYDRGITLHTHGKGDQASRVKRFHEGAVHFNGFGGIDCSGPTGI